MSSYGDIGELYQLYGVMLVAPFALPLMGMALWGLRSRRGTIGALVVAVLAAVAWTMMFGPVLGFGWPLLLTGPAIACAAWSLRRPSMLARRALVAAALLPFLLALALVLAPYILGPPTFPGGEPAPVAPLRRA